MPVPEGWRIEINDQRITEELTEKQKLTGERLQRAFINRLNSQLKEGLRECVWREKLSSEKDEGIKYKFILSLVYQFGPLALLALEAEFYREHIGVQTALMAVGFGFIGQALGNSVFSSGLLARKIDHPFEYFIPRVEIDKVARTFAYLSGKGRRLVREVGEKDKL